MPSSPLASLALLLLVAPLAHSRGASENPRTLARKGASSYREGKYDLAYRAWKRLGDWLIERRVHERPEKRALVTRYRYRTGVALFRSRRYQGAARFWRQTLSLSASHRAARRGLERLARAGKISPEEVGPLPGFPPRRDPPEEVSNPSVPEPDPPPPSPREELRSSRDALAGLSVDPDPARAAAAWERFRRARDLGREEEAREALREAFAAGRARAELDRALGLLLLREEDPDRAIFHLERFLEEESEDHRETYLALGKAHSLRGELPQEIAAYQRSLQLDPDQAQVHLMLAVAYDKAGNPPRVLEHGQRAIRIDPDTKEQLKLLIKDSETARRFEGIARDVLEKSRKERLTDELIEQYAEELATLLGEENLRRAGGGDGRERFRQTLGDIRDGLEPREALEKRFDGEDRRRFLRAYQQDPEMRRSFQKFRREFRNR